MRVEFIDENGDAGIIADNLTVVYNGAFIEQIENRVADIGGRFKWQEKPPKAVFEELAIDLPDRTPVKQAEMLTEFEEEGPPPPL